MSHDGTWYRGARLVLAFALVVMAFGMAGCEPRGGEDAPAASQPAEPEPQATPEEPEPEEPQYSSWVVNVVDDDSYEKDGITYSIALNLNATNPTGDIAGTYTGEATAKTDSVGEYHGQQLNASAMANSSALEFTLEDGSGTDANPLAPLTEDSTSLSGSGSIVMKASGSGTYGQAGGAFSNTSGQNLKVAVNGSAVTLQVSIDGHTYKFNGTIAGK